MILYHFHPAVMTATGNCQGNTHHKDCKQWGLSWKNEVSCKVVKQSPAGRPHKCEHNVPSTGSIRVPSGYELWLLPKGTRFTVRKTRGLRRTTRKKTQA